MAATAPSAFDARLAWPLAGFMALLFAVPLGLLLVISMQNGGGYGGGSMRNSWGTLSVWACSAPRCGWA